MQIITADIRNERQLMKAMEGVDVVIHCAALIDVDLFPNEKELHSVNVEGKPLELVNLIPHWQFNMTGTQKVIDSAVQSNVPYLIHISGSDVTVGPDPIYYGSENTTVIAKKPLLGPYSKSKIEAEEMVVEANGRPLANGKRVKLDVTPLTQNIAGSGKLLTVVLRPTLIYGEEDNHFVTKILSIAKANSGVLRRIDNIFIRTHPVYAGNVAHACIRAKDKMQVESNLGGEHFIITDDTKILDPFEFLEPYVNARNFQLSKSSYPYWLFIMFFALYAWLVRLLWSVHPMKLPNYLTPATVRYLCNTYFFNRTKATLRLDYEPLYDHDESLNRSIQYYKKVSL